MMAPSRASNSTAALFQSERRVPVSFSLPIVWSAPLSEKKLVSPEKNAPLTGSGSSGAAAGSKAEGMLTGCDSGKDEVVTGALHQASLGPPGADAISAVSAGRGDGWWSGSGQLGSFVTTGSDTVSSCGQTGAAQAFSVEAEGCSSSNFSFSGCAASFGSL